MCDWSVSRDEKKKKKIHLYLRMPTVAGHKLLWCGGSLLLPQSCILVFTDRILPCPPPPDGSNSQQSYLSLSRAGITRSASFPQILVLLLRAP